MESMVVNLRQLNAPKVGKLQIELECKFIYEFNIFNIFNFCGGLGGNHLATYVVD